MSGEESDSMKNNAEYQRRKYQMTKDERAIDARDQIAKDIHIQNMRDNKKTTYEDAVRKATEIAHKVLREDG